MEAESLEADRTETGTDTETKDESESKIGREIGKQAAR